MNNTAKKITALAAVALIAGIAAYGSYLPLRKAQNFIAALQSLQAPATHATSIQDLESRLSVPLDYPSPIGQEELVRNMANSILVFVQRGSDATSTSELIRYLHSYYDPIIARGVGMSFGQDIYLMGAINEIAFAHTGNPSYLGAAERYYAEGNGLGPNRPQTLYGLFDVYRAEGNVAGTEAVAQKILANWPADTGIRTAVAQFRQTVGAAANTKTTKGK